MLIKGADIVGRKVISVKENKEVETIDDIIYDPKENKVISFLLTSGDTLTEPKVIMFKKLQSITPDAVMIKSLKDVLPGSKAIKPMTGDDEKDTYLKGTKVTTENGDVLGIAKDICFNQDSGQVEEFVVMTGNDEEINIKITDIVTSTSAETIIKSEKAKDESQGGGMVDKLKDKLGL